MEDFNPTMNPEIQSDPSCNPELENEKQMKPTGKSLKSVVRESLSGKSRLSLKSKSSGKSKLSSKSRPVENSQSNKVLLTKSLDTVKTMLASKDPSERNLKVTESVKKISRSTSIGTFLRKRKIKAKKSKRQKMREKFFPLDADGVRKVARELIRKRGYSLLDVHPVKKDKKRPHKKKSKDQ